MRYGFLFILFNLFCINSFCQSKDLYGVPDSIKAVGFYAEVKIAENIRSKINIGGIVANNAVISFGYNKLQRIIHFGFSDKSNKDVAFGKNVYEFGKGNAWNYEWKNNTTYPLLIVTATDSASHKTLYSGYIYLNDEKKWKLISTRNYNDTNAIKNIETQTKEKDAVTCSNRWLLRSNGTWKALDSQTTKPPVLRHMSDIDSLDRQRLEEEMLRSKLPKDSINYKEGIFYQYIQDGAGKLIKVTDTLTVHYKGSLFGYGTIFDQTKEKPATFPLERLIKGWQIGLSHSRVGGKIRLFIPSAHAYGIRTRSANIPPNSILVFDIEVLEAKEKIPK